MQAKRHMMSLLEFARGFIAIETEAERTLHSLYLYLYLSLSLYIYIYEGTHDEMAGSTSDDWIYWHFG
jgi:hypothetical protein